MSQHIKLEPSELADLAAISEWTDRLPSMSYLRVQVIELRGVNGLIVQVDRASGRVDYVEPQPSADMPF